MEAMVFRVIVLAYLALGAWFGFLFGGVSGFMLGFFLFYMVAGAVCAIGIGSNGDRWEMVKARARIFFMWLPGIFSFRVFNWLMNEDK